MEERIGQIEVVLFGRPKPGPMLKRVNELEIALHGTDQRGTLVERVDSLVTHIGVPSSKGVRTSVSTNARIHIGPKGARKQLSGRENRFKPTSVKGVTNATRGVQKRTRHKRKRGLHLAVSARRAPKNNAGSEKQQQADVRAKAPAKTFRITIQNQNGGKR